MKKIIVPKEEYTFDASEGVILIGNGYVVNPQTVLLITNVTNNEIIYNFGCSNYGATVEEQFKKINLEYDTTSMNDDDELQIVLHVEETTSDKMRDSLLTTTNLNTDTNDAILAELVKMNKTLKKILE